MDPTALIGLATGGAGGLLGGNILGALTKSGAGTKSLVGIVGGALATQFLGPTLGPIVGNLVGGGMGAMDLGGIVGNLAVGAGGGGILTLVVGLLKSMFAR